MRANVSFAPTIEGLRQAHCDPLILAIHVEEDALKGLTAEVDWRLAGQLTDWMRDGQSRCPDFNPRKSILPAGRLLFWRVGSAAPQDLFDALNDLGEKLGSVHETLASIDGKS